MNDLRPFGPRPADSPLQACYLCKEPLATGEYTTLVGLGPGADPEARRRCAEGRPYNALAIEIHWGCGTGLPDPS